MRIEEREDGVFVELPLEDFKCLTGLREKLLAACKAALGHVSELRDAWQSGAITERDGRGGTRSNRNVVVERIVRGAIEEAEACHSKS